MKTSVFSNQAFCLAVCNCGGGSCKAGPRSKDLGMVTRWLGRQKPARGRVLCSSPIAGKLGEIAQCCEEGGEEAGWGQGKMGARRKRRQ